MSSPRPGAVDLAQLRAEFDQSFARKTVTAAQGQQDLLAVRADNMHLALRATQTAAVLRCPALTALPSSNAALCGLAGVRGTLVAVYSLAELVGGKRGSVANRWLALCAADLSVALLFDELVGYARVESHDILATQKGKAQVAGAGQLARFGGAQRPLLHIPELLETIYRSAGSGETKV